MTPRRITLPVLPVVTLADMKRHLRVDDDGEDLLIQGYIDAAVSHLEGYRGLLGRAIMPQTWAVDYTSAGAHRLPLPDVTDAEATVGTVTLAYDAQGAVATITEPCTVEFDCALPAELLPAVRQAVKLLAGHWYQNREGGSDKPISEIPLAVDALLSAARWGRL